jgi:hypothetical protein
MVNFEPDFEIMVKRYLSHKFIASFMLEPDQKAKLAGTYKWGEDSAQDKANFNKNMRRKLKLWLKELPDMIRILNGLPPRVIENAKLDDELPAAIEFFDTFLAKSSPLPIGEYESGESRIFSNFAVSIEGRPDIAALERSWHTEEINGKKYRIVSISWKAGPGEIRRNELLKNHAENIQKYIDPTAVSAIFEGNSILDAIDREYMKKRSELIGVFNLSHDSITAGGCIPTNPPRPPKILISAKDAEENQKKH